MNYWDYIVEAGVITANQSWDFFYKILGRTSPVWYGNPENLPLVARQAMEICRANKNSMGSVGDILLPAAEVQNISWEQLLAISRICGDKTYFCYKLYAAGFFAPFNK